MQCGTEAEIKGRHRQTEMGLVGGVGGWRGLWGGGGLLGVQRQSKDGKVRKIAWGGGTVALVLSFLLI